MESKTKIYRSIDSLPLWNYIQVEEKNDLRYLLILDYYDVLPTIQVDPNIWAEIQLQAFEASGKKADNYTNELKRLIIAQQEYRQIKDCTFILSYKKDPEIIAILEKILQEYDQKFKINLNSDKEYLASVIEADRQSQGLASDLAIKTKHFNNKYHNLEGDKKINYNSIINNLSKYYGYRVKPKEITVREFLSMNADLK